MQPPITIEVDEKTALAEVMLDPTFAAFYAAERPKIPGQIHFRLMPPGSMGNAQASRQSTPGGIVRSIAMPRLPVPLTDVATAAEEIEHLVLGECYPSTFVLPAEWRGNSARPSPVLPVDSQLSAHVGGVVHEALAHRTLRIFGFDLEGKLAERAEPHALPPEPAPKSDLWTEFVLRYVGDILRYEEAGVPHLAEQFQGWFDPACPNIAKEGQALLVTIRKYGFHDFIHIWHIFSDLLVKYELDWRIGIRSPFQPMSAVASGMN